MDETRVRVWIQIFKGRKNPVLQWLDPVTGKRKSKTASTADASKLEAERGDLESDLNNDRYQEASRMTWQNFREKFLDEYASGTRPATQANFEDTLDLFEELCDPARLKSVNERLISAFVSAMRQRPTRGRPGMMPSTIKVKLQFLHTALTWAVEQKMLTKVPKFPSVKVPKKKPQPIATESFERLFLKARDDNMRAFLLSGWLGGLRLGEASSLEWEETQKAPWVDFNRNRIIFPAEVVKSVEDQWVPLDPILKQALLKLPRHNSKVFCFVRGGKQLTLSGISDRVTDLAKKAGVRLTMHSLRKGFGCRYAQTASAHVLQRLMRHSSIKTTMDFYANIDAAVEAAVLGNNGSASGLSNDDLTKDQNSYSAVTGN